MQSLFQIILMGPPAGGADANPNAGLFNILFLVGIFAVMYFFMIRPQAKKAKAQKQFNASVAKGEKIVTIGGIHGRILKENDTTVELEIDTNVKVIVERSAISMEMTKALQQQAGAKETK